jgi:hypothetical protein
MEALAEPVGAPSEKRLGRRFWAGRAPSSPIIPGPIDFRGGRGTTVLDTGGYWFCRRERAVPDPFIWSAGPEIPGVLAGCLLELLGRRKSEPDRPGRVLGWAVVRVVPPFEDEVAWGLGDMLLSSLLFVSRMPPSPVGDGNWVSLKSVEADSILLCRSSKLTEGKKSKEAVESFNWFDSPSRLKEKRE